MVKEKITTVDAGADTGMLDILPHVEYDAIHALAEYIDNSIQSYVDNKKKLEALNPSYKLLIQITVKNRKIEIKDNAAGIPDSRFQDAFKAAKKIKKNNQLNEFGMGMKAASYWFTPTWRVLTKSIEEKETKLVKLDLRKIVDFNQPQIKVQRVDNKSKFGFTHIFLDDITKTVNTRNINKSIDHIASIHRHFINNKKIIIKFNDHIIKFTEPTFKKSYPYAEYKKWLELYKNDLKSKTAKKNKPKMNLWKRQINIKFGKNNQYIANGYVGILDESKRSAAGLYYFRRGRCIQEQVYPEDIFPAGSKGTQRYNSIYGEINFLNSETTFNKRSIQFDDPYAEEEFATKLLKELEKKPDLWSEAKQSGKSWELLMESEMFYLQNKNETESKIDDILEVLKKHGAKQASRAIKTDQKIKHENLPPKVLPMITEKKKIKIEKKDKVKLDGKNYSYVVEKTYDENRTDPWCQYSMDPDNQIITVRISMVHEFVQTYFNPQKKENSLGLEYIATYLVMSEIHARNEGGLGNKASVVRENFNKILYQLPPRERKKLA